MSAKVKNWACIEVRHVVPLNDMREHKLFQACWCSPRVEEPGETGYVLVHNSLDGREELERQTGAGVVLS